MLLSDNRELKGRYWDVPEPADELPNAEELCEEYLSLFMDSVRMQLRADVPIGTCLSGGIDSSSIVVAINELMRREFGLASIQLGQRQKTFSAIYDSQRHF
jgi:asparagine synthase (glutamine-hydrolysing)